MSCFEIKDFFEIDKFSYKELFYDIEDVWQALINLKKVFKEKPSAKIKTKIPSTCHLEKPELIFIDENTLIEPNTFIRGPCIIGKNSEIRHGAYIRGNVIAGDNCIIGHATEIKNSILLNNVHAAHFAYIGDSILGNNVNLGAGVRCANFRIDKKDISFLFDGKKINTNLNKLGAIIGDNSQIGCNTVLNPATFIEKQVACYANLTLSGYFEKNSIVKQANRTFIKKSKLRDLKNEFNVSGKK